MKQTRLIYSNFSPSRPESTCLLELWCFFGGAITAIYILCDSGAGAFGKPPIEMILSLVLPGVYFYINYLARYIRWMRVVLISSIVLGIAVSGYLIYFPEYSYRRLPSSDTALITFSLIALILVPKRRAVD